ncbi:MAG: hypothetical protein HY652_10110 [Acidobacteria bacterium]|nr:hypothetical protein [Acidobacteriota bacterium]
MSIPERSQPGLNALYIGRGLYIEAGRRDEVLVSEAFAQANGLDPGDTLGAVINGRWQRLRIVGIALSPEYVYEIRGTDLFPDNKRFGVLWMSRDALGAAFDMEGAFNDVSLSLAPGAPDAMEAEVIARLDRLLEPYGGLSAYGRREQISHRFLSDEIAQNRVFGIVLPSIFLGVAAFLIHIVLSRLVGTQREQIAVLKAFGYGNLAIGGHYVRFAVVAVLAGAAVGTGIGLWWGRVVGELYAQFYRFPVRRFDAGPGAVLLAVLVSAGAAVLGALGAARRASALPPAEAMQPEPPASFRPGLIERLGLTRFFSLTSRIIVRDLERRPYKALVSTMGIALAVVILVVGHYFEDAVRHIAEVQFRNVQRDDVTIVFNDPRPARAVYEVAYLPGVLRSEPFRTVPARLRHEHRTRRIALFGLAPEGELRRLVGQDLRTIEVPSDGMVLTTRLAEILGVAPGDRLTVEVLEGKRPVRAVTVAGLVDELVGLSAYMDVRALNRLMSEGGTVSGSFLLVDPPVAPHLYSVLKRLPAVGGVSFRKAALAGFEETLATGRLSRIELHEGDPVGRGMVLARLTPVPIDARTLAQDRARLDAAQAEKRAADARVERARAALEQAQREHQRADELSSRGLKSPQEREQTELVEATYAKELEAAVFAAQAAAFQVDAARAALLAAGSVTQGADAAPGGPARSTFITVQSPIRGRVLRVLQESERVVTTALPSWSSAILPCSRSSWTSSPPMR